MSTNPLASIIINNYNYAQFLQEAIESALQQTFYNIEVIVVDDGSKDDSRNIIAAYGDRIVPVLKQNGGQASALNMGIKASKGEIIFFLDADDTFLPNKVEVMIKFFAQVIQESPDIIISNYIETIDAKGSSIDINFLDTLRAICCWNYLDKIRGKKRALIDGIITKLSTPEQAYQFASKYRFIPYLGVPTSGFAMTRSLAKKIFPLPQNSSKISADDFIVKAASLLGTVYLTSHVLTKYRIHGKNNWYGTKEVTKEVCPDSIDDFLNAKLESTGRRAVFSYFDSMHAKSHYRAYYGHSCGDKLLKLSIKVIQWHVNLTTIVFFIKTTLLAVIFKVRCTVARLKPIH
jgi:glycosyltransferase involved in cell wall biosynthesis